MTDADPPPSVAAFHDRLAALSDDLPRRLQQCAEYVAANTDRIAVSTVAEMAAGAGVPPSALMRFCKMMGFSGYSDMQRLFRESYAQGWPDYATRLRHLRETGAGSPSALLAEFADAGRKSLENLVNAVDARALDQAVARLSGAPTIHVVGMRRSFPAASYLAYAFEKMEIPALLHDGTARLDRRHLMRPGDVLIAISFAPYSEATIELAAEARRRGLDVVAVTDTALSPLRRTDPVLLAVPEMDFGAFRALSATLSLAITLAVAVGAARERA